MRICELRQKEVINTCTCRSLGCPIDIEFDCSDQAAFLPLSCPGPADSAVSLAEMNSSSPGNASARSEKISSW